MKDGVRWKIVLPVTPATRSPDRTSPYLQDKQNTGITVVTWRTRTHYKSTIGSKGDTVKKKANIRETERTERNWRPPLAWKTLLDEEKGDREDGQQARRKQKERRDN